MKYDKSELLEKLNLKRYTKYTLKFFSIRFSRHEFTVSWCFQRLHKHFSQPSQLLYLSCGPGTVHGAAPPPTTLVKSEWSQWTTKIRYIQLNHPFSQSVCIDFSTFAYVNCTYYNKSDNPSMNLKTSQNIPPSAQTDQTEV